MFKDALLLTMNTIFPVVVLAFSIPFNIEACVKNKTIRLPT
jgi:hypothetical protein